MAGATKLMTAGGGGVTMTPASSIAADVTVNVPSQNCTLDIQGPAFSATMSTNQSVTTGTFTKVAFNTEGFDTNSNYDTTTYRFTPTVAGYYQFNFGINTNTSVTQVNVNLYKNNVSTKGSFAVSSSALAIGAYSSTVLYMNGSTDYVEIFAYLVGTTPAINNSAVYSYFNGALVRAG